MSPAERESETRKRLLLIEEQIDRALDEIKEIREGGAVQTTLGD